METICLANDARDAIDGIKNRCLQLESENAQLKRQLQHLQALAGPRLSAEDVRQWVDAMEASNPRAFKNEVRMGDANWHPLNGYPLGGGLRGLQLDLTAIPGDDKISRIGWDVTQRRREDKWKGDKPFQRQPYPPRFKNDLTIETVLRRRGQDGLADLLQQLQLGLVGKARIIVGIFFLLYGEDAIRRLSTEPAKALEDLLTEIRRSHAAAQEDTARRFAELFAGLTGHGEKRKAAYVTLNVDSDADATTIKSAYRRLAREHHPDLGGDTEKFRQVTEAYELLTA